MENADRVILQEIFNHSAQMYAFIARLYRVEVDNELFAELKKSDFSLTPDIPQIDEGYKMMDAFLKSHGEDPITDLAVDYARTFLGYGPTAGQGAFPYESVYTSHDAVIMQEARDEVVALYRDENMERENSFDEPEDHIAFELVYLEHLCYKIEEALQNDDDSALSLYLNKKANFMQNHIMNWVPRFCIDVEKVAGTDFYKALAKITLGYLEMGLELMEELQPTQTLPN